MNTPEDDQSRTTKENVNTPTGGTAWILWIWSSTTICASGGRNWREDASSSALTPRSWPTATARRIPSRGTRDSRA